MGVYKFIGATKTMNPNDTAQNKQYQIYLWLNNLLAKAGFNTKLRGFVIAQVMHETGGMTSRISKPEIKNITGIEYRKASPFQSGKSGRYAIYSSYENWAKDLARILKLKPGYPWGASDLEDYAKRLKTNKYYEDSTSNYLNAITQWALKNNKAINWAKAVNNEMKSNPIQNTVNTEGWTKEDDNEVLRQENKNDFFDITKWSLSTKIFAGVGALATLAIITRR